MCNDITHCQNCEGFWVFCGHESAGNLSIAWSKALRSKIKCLSVSPTAGYIYACR